MLQNNSADSERTALKETLGTSATRLAVCEAGKHA